jgi:hypothetical protein
MVFIAKAFKCEKSYRIKILINGAKLPTIWIFRHSHFPRKKKKHACYHLNMWSIRVSVSPLSVILFLLPVLGQFDSLTLYYVRTIYIYIYNTKSYLFKSFELILPGSLSLRLTFLIWNSTLTVNCLLQRKQKTIQLG